MLCFQYLGNYIVIKVYQPNPATFLDFELCSQKCLIVNYVNSTYSKRESRLSKQRVVSPKLVHVVDHNRNKPKHCKQTVDQLIV